MLLFQGIYYHVLPKVSLMNIRRQKIWKAILLRRRALEKSGVAHIP